MSLIPGEESLPIGDDEWMRSLPGRRFEFHHGDETSEIVNIAKNVFAILHSRHQKQFRPLRSPRERERRFVLLAPYLIDLCPEAMFQLSFPLVQFLVHLLVEIHMGQDAHHPRQSVDLSDVQEFEGFHFEAEFHVD